MLNQILRTFYSYEMSELFSEYDVKGFNGSSPLRQRANSLQQNQVTKTENSEGDRCGVPITSNNSKSKPNKPFIPREPEGIGLILYIINISLYNVLDN